MRNLGERGVIQFIILFILIAGLLAGLYLVQKTQIFKPKASVSEPTTSTTSFVLMPAAYKDTVKVGETIEVSLLVHTDIAAANLFDAKINFNKDFLAVDKIDATGSIITSWVEQFSDNNTGTISLVGGVPNPGLQTQVGDQKIMAKFIFKVLKTGETTISFDDLSAIYSNADNINILTKKENLALTLGGTAIFGTTQDVKVWLLTYRPTGSFSNELNNDPAGYTKNTLLPAMNEASKYHGYSNPNAQPVLNYTLADVDIHTENNPPPQLNGGYDYAQLFQKYDLCNLAKSNNIKAVILWADGSGPYAGGFWESAITGNKGFTTNGANLSYCPDKTIVVYGLNYTRGLPEALESYGHHLERVFGQFKSEYASFSDRNSCGNDHNPPNSRSEYDRSNTALFESDCRDFKADGTGAKETLNCNTWGCSSDGWLKFWMQSMPFNWWVYIGDPDNISSAAPAPVPVPAPLPSPVITPEPKICTAVITYACEIVSPTNCKEFPSSCLPDGWTKSSAVPVPTAKPTATPAGTGDANGDGKANLIDLSILLSDFNKEDGFRAGVDLNGDGRINAFDFSLIRNLLIVNKVIRG